jgi:chemotaxis protein methyltransferase CheR
MSATVPISEEAVRRLANLLLERIGLRQAKENESALRLALLSRLSALGEPDAVSYVNRLVADGREELRALLPLVTVGKTEFFRDPTQFRALRQKIFPELLARSRAEMRPMRIWSAGCATGEEAYSLAMLASEMGIEPSGVDLLATDVNTSALEQAAEGRFNARRMPSVPPDLLRRFFIPRGRDEYEVIDSIKRYVRLQPHNLAATLFPAPKDSGLWDLILCRNVIIYFDAPTIVRVIGQFHRNLSQSGYLCLGYSESLYRISSDFELAEIEGAFLYRKPREHKREPLRRRIEETPVVKAHAIPMAEAHRHKAQAGWRSPSGQAAETVHRPAAQLDGEQMATPGTSHRAASPNTRRLAPSEIVAVEDPMATVMRWLEQGEFDRVLAMLNHDLERSPGSLAMRLTLGNVLTVMGRHPEARAAYQTALAAEPLCAEAHLCLGIACYEAGKDREEEALLELTRALYLDPSLILAHYYAGQLAERRGDRLAARRSYRNAINAGRSQTKGSPLLGYFPGVPTDPSVLARAASFALAAVGED